MTTALGEPDSLNDLFNIINPAGVDIKGKIKSLFSNTKTAFPYAIRIPITGGCDDTTAYYEQLSVLRDNIQLLRTRFGLVEHLHIRILNSTTPEESQAHIASIENAVTTIDKISRFILEKLGELNESNVKFSKRSKSPEEVKDRIKHHAHVAKLFLEATGDFRELQNKYKSMYRDMIKRHITISKSNATQQDIDNISAKLGNNFGNVTALSVIIDRQNAYESLENATLKNKEILKLEQSVFELYHLFAEMGTMISIQTESILGTENNIEKTSKHAGNGVKELQVGIKYHKRSRKKITYVVITIVTVIFLFVGLALVGSYV